MAEERLKLAVFIDFDNIQIGVKDTLGKDFDVSLVLESLKERGEVVTKVAYGDWPRAGDQSRQMTQHAVQMVQRNVTPRGDKNGADINLALDALEMAFNRPHINAFAIVGGDSDYIPLVEKLKQYDKRVFVVGGRTFTSNILQRNCTEFIAYEHLLKSGASGDGSRPARGGRRGERPGRSVPETRDLSAAFPNIQRALKILAEREVAPQLGLLKSTVLQLDSAFSERDYGVGSFLEFMQKMERAGLVHLRRSDGSFLVELAESETAGKAEGQETSAAGLPAAAGLAAEAGTSGAEVSSEGLSPAEALELLKSAFAKHQQKAPNRPLYLRQIRQALRSGDKKFDERGSRAILDLLHQAQREGHLRLQRDRKGVLRVFPIASTAATSPPPGEPARERPSFPAGEISLPEMGGVPSDTAPAEKIAAGEMTLPEELPVAEQAVAGESESGHRTRKPRHAASAKRSRRKAPAHRKPKDSPAD